jgi:hypothetical protein
MRPTVITVLSLPQIRIPLTIVTFAGVFEFMPTKNQQFSFMKKLFAFLLAAATIVRCSPDDAPGDVIGSVSFVVNDSGLGAGRIAGLTPEKVVVSVEDQDGKVVFNNKIFALTSTDHGYESEKLPFTQGEYRITKYLVISGTTAAYATPKTGSEKAQVIDQPLPFGFSVSSKQDNAIAPDIVGISPQDTPQKFGYNDFGYDIPGSGSDEYFNVRVKLEMTLGGIYYPNVDAPFTVKGFNENDELVWREVYDYTGPEANELKIKDGFHHYTIETTKWGKDLSIPYTRSTLFERRVREGEVPITQVFQAEANPKKVASTITSWSKEVDGSTIMVPISKTNYEYHEGRISLIQNSTWSELDEEFIDDTRMEFTYSQDRVFQIQTRQSGTNIIYSEDTYTYDDLGQPIHIQHKGEGVTTEIDLSYLKNNRVVKATYRLSNGRGFEYEFMTEHGSIKSDKTTRNSQLCSEATYTSDKNINPLKHLGYTDYLLRNYSASNRLTESANYVACSFPSLMAESYEYVYDEDGYPVRATTTFKGTDSRTEVQYTYIR